MVETPTIDKDIRMRAIASRRAFRELYQQHKLWLKAYKHADSDIARLAQERDAKFRKVLEAYNEADTLFKGVVGL